MAKRKATKAKPKRKNKPRARPKATKRERELAREVEQLKRELYLAEKRARSNPKRPPKRWFDDCIARVRASGTADAPAAVCGAAWWKLPESRRRAIVQRYEHSKSKRGRTVALAMAKAERAHHHRHHAKRKNNPPRKLVELVYLEQKSGDGEPTEYVHKFRGDLPDLSMRGGRLQVNGGTYRTKRGWIVG
jgi:hypothetical protein